MKHLFRFGSRWARRAAAMLPALPLLLLPATGHSAAPEAPPSQGFIKDMSPLLGENGRILAIAPDCRALTGIVDGRPFIWNRDFDSILLTPPSEYYGMGEALSDDGRTVIGFIRHRDEGAPPGYGQTWASLGFFWQYDKELLLMPQHGLVDVTWRGLSADGTVAAGKGKNTPYHPDANVDNIVNYFPSLKKMDRANPRMICEFVDGSKTAIEMSAIANAAGLHPDLQELDPTGVGMRGPHCTRDNLHQIFAPVSEGGIIQGEAQDVIEYCYGVSPGVFCVVRGDYDTAKESFASFGGGGTYPLYRPYHLTSLETPLAAAKAALLHESSIAPLDRLSCEVVCVTKKDLQPGEVIDHIGGFCVRGYLRDYDKAKAEGLLPLGLAAGSVVKRPVKAGEFLTYDDVDLNPSSTIVTLRKLQDTLMK